MATVTLTRFEAEYGRLPSRCMCCGEPSTITIAKTFSWTPPWAYFSLFCSLLPFLLVAMLTTKKITMDVPLCHEHRNHWRGRNAFILISLVLYLLGIVAAAMLGGFDQANPAVRTVTGVGTLAGAGTWLILTIILLANAVRTAKITDRTITLKGVSPAFVTAVAEKHLENPELDQLVSKAGSSSAFSWIPVTVLVALAIIVCLAAISAIGDSKNPPIAQQQQPAPVVNTVPVIDKKNRFILLWPGVGWSIEPNARRLNVDAAAAATHVNGQMGMILVEDAGELVVAGQEEVLAKIVIDQAELTDKKIVRIQALDFQGQKAVRFQYTGTGEDQSRVRVEVVAFVCRGKAYQVSTVGLANATTEDGSSFAPFVRAFSLMDNAPADPKPAPAVPAVPAEKL